MQEGNGRGRGFSLREELISRGITDEEALSRHMLFVLETEKVTGKYLDITRYRPHPSNPNLFPAYMG